MKRPREKRGGLRAVMYDLADDSHRIAPKRTAKRHPASWYTDGHLAARPEFAFCALANYAEYLLFTVRRSRVTPEASSAVSDFYAHTRARLDNVLTNYPSRHRFRGAELETMRSAARELCAEAKACSAVVASSTRAYDRCPACGGRLNKADAELLRQILSDASENGIIPLGSRLYTVAT